MTIKADKFQLYSFHASRLVIVGRKRQYTGFAAVVKAARGNVSRDASNEESFKSFASTFPYSGFMRKSVDA